MGFKDWNHVSKCRLCLSSFGVADSRKISITFAVQRQFFILMGTEVSLKKNPSKAFKLNFQFFQIPLLEKFSKYICETRDCKLKEFYEFRHSTTQIQIELRNFETFMKPQVVITRCDQVKIEPCSWLIIEEIKFELSELNSLPTLTFDTHCGDIKEEQHSGFDDDIDLAADCVTERSDIDSQKDTHSVETSSIPIAGHPAKDRDEDRLPKPEENVENSSDEINASRKPNLVNEHRVGLLQNSNSIFLFLLGAISEEQQTAKI